MSSDWLEEVQTSAPGQISISVTSAPDDVLPGPPPPSGVHVRNLHDTSLPLSRVYVRNLHQDTSLGDLTTVFGTISPVLLNNISFGKVQRNRRWVKFDVPEDMADELISKFNFFCGITFGQAQAEYART